MENQQTTCVLKPELVQTLWPFMRFENPKFLIDHFRETQSKAKLPKRLCAKLANLMRSQNSIEATAKNSRWQTMLICRET
ncbi:hypothetical protein EA24_18405 [Vibrio navarrensis]|nr:hypothetical protein EA24_18405 [Vibrio navarrensis]